MEKKGYAKTKEVKGIQSVTVIERKNPE